MKRFAVIDLGTNTFHILIAAVHADGTFDTLYKERVFVKLAEKGIETIADEPFERAINAIARFKELLSEYEVTRVSAFGTAALRTASNGRQLAKQIEEQFNIKIDIISGDEEARLIHKGVMQAVPPQGKLLLLMDIGGGSVEFIIADDEKVYWSESFPIGVAVLYKRFHQNDPMTDFERENIALFLDKALVSFLAAVEAFPNIYALVGASGTFDVLKDLLAEKHHNPLCAELPAQRFYPLYDSIMQTTIDERRNMEKIPYDRVEMIVVGFELIKYVLEKTRVKKIIVSDYAMKEGILQNMMEKEVII